MMEEASEDGIAGEDTTGAHRFINTSCHFEHAVPVACVYDQVEDLSIGQAHTLGFQLAYHL